ncbi:MAG: nuclear transport factor 2 family protein, partial [Gammaproteobacteria bacterium]|nr:nuclear transport factor 2 family protein [Gammaproteobacteria bacterium]
GESGAEHSHAEADSSGGGHAPAVATAPEPIDESGLSPAEAEVVAALAAYHAALTSGDPAAPEQFVLADERFLMIEGKHLNQGWADYRDNHLKGELADLAKVRFRLTVLGIQLEGDLATVSFLFNVLPKTGPEMDFGSGRASAALVRTGNGWKLRQLHTS